MASLVEDEQSEDEGFVVVLNLPEEDEFEIINASECESEDLTERHDDDDDDDDDNDDQERERDRIENDNGCESESESELTKEQETQTHSHFLDQDGDYDDGDDDDDYDDGLDLNDELVPWSQKPKFGNQRMRKLENRGFQNNRSNLSAKKLRALTGGSRAKRRSLNDNGKH